MNLKLNGFFLCYFIFIQTNAYCQANTRINFKTKTGDSITILDNFIYYNKILISKNISGIIYQSKYNRIIEQGGNILLFVEIDGRPNFNRIKAFLISNDSIKELANSVYNDAKQGSCPPPFSDLDHDGYLEYGGFDLTEVYPKADSMYYVPTTFYKISNGTVYFDSLLSRKMDMKINGIYLKKYLDKDGNCCIIISKPKK